MAKRFESKLDATLIAELNEKFERKSWSNFRDYDFFFEGYCDFLENLNDDELDLILELTDDYKWITQSDYHEYLTDALEKLSGYSYLNLDKIYILPLLSKEDREKGKDKSSRIVAYQCMETRFNYNRLFSDTTFQRIDNLDLLPRATKISADKNPVILVDDYVGTGETAESALNHLLEVREYDRKYVFVASLVTQEIGMNHIISQGYNFLVSLVRNRGISDKYTPTQAAVKKDIMLGLEKRIGVEQKDVLGYGQSEGLITMIRTPNNTFSAYWFEPKNKKWKPPFPRKSR